MSELTRSTAAALARQPQAGDILHQEQAAAGRPGRSLLLVRALPDQAVGIREDEAATTGAEDRTGPDRQDSCSSRRGHDLRICWMDEEEADESDMALVTCPKEAGSVWSSS